MSKLWLTYAWKDNENQDVDHIVVELRANGVTVDYDRIRLMAGQRVWPQIDKAISDPDTSAWAMLVTEASLRSEPCLEEIAYALDRALRTRGSEFPLIGIFPSPLDRSLIPSAIATRLYVNLTDPDWAKRIAAAVLNAPLPSPDPPLPFAHSLHERPDGVAIEVWPRSGAWTPFFVLVPEEERHLLVSAIPGPRGYLTGTGMVSRGDISDPGRSGFELSHRIDAHDTAHIFFKSLPSRLWFGQPGQPACVIVFTPT